MHLYAVYYIHQDGSKTAGYAESVTQYFPGDSVQMGSLLCLIDFEILSR